MNTGVDGGGALRRALALLMCAMSALPAAALAATVAMVTDLQGRAVATADGRSQDVTILSELGAGAVVRLDAGASLVALYLDGGDEYVFKGPASIAFGAAQPKVESGSAPEKRTLSLGKDARSVRIRPVGVAQGGLVMRGVPGSARIQLLSPQATRTLELRPEFRWRELEPGLTYAFALQDAEGRTTWESQVDATSYTLPEAVPVREGASYTWSVSTRLADGRKYSSSADFAVASSELRSRAEALRPAASAPLSTRVAYAAWLDEMGLKEEARRYWRLASAERPDDARLKALAKP